jgi:hypothetical protein
MIQLFCAVEGEIEYVAYNDEEMIEYLKEFYPTWQREYPRNYVNETKPYYYVYPAFRAWQINKRLKAGKVLVGVDVDSFLFTEKPVG